MPHVLIEHSSNVSVERLKTFFSTLHTTLNETIVADIGACKSRRIVHEDFYIADGSTNHAFVHAQIQIMPGRTEQQKQALSTETMKLLQAHFTAPRTIHFSVNISELSEGYLKEDVS